MTPRVLLRCPPPLPHPSQDGAKTTSSAYTPQDTTLAATSQDAVNPLHAIIQTRTQHRSTSHKHNTVADTASITTDPAHPLRQRPNHTKKPPLQPITARPDSQTRVSILLTLTSASSRASSALPWPRRAAARFPNKVCGASSLTNRPRGVRHHDGNVTNSSDRHIRDGCCKPREAGGTGGRGGGATET